MQKPVTCESCMPIVDPDSEIVEAVRKPIVGDEVLSVLYDLIDEVAEAANLRELRLPAVTDLATACAF